MQIATAASVGVHGIENYTCDDGCNQDDATYANLNSEYFLDELVDFGYDNEYEKYDCSADSDDFTVDDDVYVDAVDIAYFSGHGNLGQIAFGAQNSECIITLDDMQFGDGNLEWLILDTCLVLNYTYIVTQNNWPNDTFDGLHHIFGHETKADPATYRGRYFARRADGWNCIASTLELSWFYATQYYGASNTRGALIRDATTPCGGDYLHGTGGYCADDGDGTSLTHVYWTN
ncbi:MAG: hypothetical protein JXB49_22335 [Bacteroidales bacterium]|nr:hypothetical protein [Bacteroidales bacterium]